MVVVRNLHTGYQYFSQLPQDLVILPSVVALGQGGLAPNVLEATLLQRQQPSEIYV